MREASAARARASPGAAGGGFYRASGSADVGGGLFWLRVNLFGQGGLLRGTQSR